MTKKMENRITISLLDTRMRPIWNTSTGTKIICLIRSSLATWLIFNRSATIGLTTIKIKSPKISPIIKIGQRLSIRRLKLEIIGIDFTSKMLTHPLGSSNKQVIKINL